MIVNYGTIDKIAYRFDIKRRLEQANGRVDDKERISLTNLEKKKFEENWVGGNQQVMSFIKLLD